MPRETAFQRLNRHFHTHPRGRLHEILFWGGLGVVVGAVAFWGWRGDWMATPIALILAVVAACLVGWGLLPHARGPPKPPTPGGKRGQIAEQVRKSKSERKNKGGVPPGPPIRRG